MNPSPQRARSTTTLAAKLISNLFYLPNLLNVGRRTLANARQTYTNRNTVHSGQGALPTRQQVLPKRRFSGIKPNANALVALHENHTVFTQIPREIYRGCYSNSYVYFAMDEQRSRTSKSRSTPISSSGNFILVWELTRCAKSRREKIDPSLCKPPKRSVGNCFLRSGPCEQQTRAVS
jgi:hypothetical protein